MTISLRRISFTIPLCFAVAACGDDGAVDAPLDASPGTTPALDAAPDVTAPPTHADASAPDAPPAADANDASDDGAADAADAEAAAPRFHVRVHVAGDGYGHVDSSDVPIACPVACDTLAAASSQVTLHTTAAIGSVFAGWEGPCAGTGDCALRVTGDVDVTARFVKPFVAWGRSFGGTDWDGATQVVIDGKGRIVVAGEFNGTATFGGPPVTAPSPLNSGFVLVLDADTGEVVWSRALPTSGPLVAAATEDGSVLVSADVPGTTTFDGKPLANGANLLKLDASTGKVVWTRSFVPAVARAMTALPGGDVALGGSFGAPMDFGQGSVTPTGSDDGFVLRLAGDTGATRWVRVLGGQGQATVMGLAPDASGGVALVAQYYPPITIGSQTLTATNAGLAVARLAGATGAPQWARGFEGQTVPSVRFDAAGDVLLVGRFWATLSLDGHDLHTTPVPSNPQLEEAPDLFLAKLTGGAGAYVWSRAIDTGGEPSTPYPPAPTIDFEPWPQWTNAGPVIAGIFYAPFDLGDGQTTYPSSKVWDGFLSRIDDATGASTVLRMGTGCEDWAQGAARLPNGDLVVAGGFADACSMGGVALSPFGGADAYVVRLKPGAF